MTLQVNQTINAYGYITDAKFLHGSVSDFEVNLGYHKGRLQGGFYIGHLLRLPAVHEFEIAGYSITPAHRFNTGPGLDTGKLKELALMAMRNIGARNLVKVFPKIKHNPAMDDDKQYPYGKGGIPQWKLIKELPIQIFKEVEASHSGNINLRV